MLTLEAGLKFLKETKYPRYLPIDWSWHTNNGNGGICLALIKTEHLGRHRVDPGWTVHTRDAFTFFTTSYIDGKAESTYSYLLADGSAWPLAVRREFHGVAEDQVDLLEEFRQFHNLWHDRSTNEYFVIKHDGTKEKVVYRAEDGALVADTVLVRKYCAARGLTISIQLDVVEFFDDPVATLEEDENCEEFVFSMHTTNDAHFARRAAFGRLIGKRFIPPLSVEECGIWPYEPRKAYTDFIIGIDDTGRPILCTSDPEELADYFGKNRGRPHYLTPVFFRKEVLTRYYAKPSIFSVSDGYLHCGSLWGLRLDNDHQDKVVVFLGDLGRDLPESEQVYWRSFNVAPEGSISETCFKRAFDGQFADPKDINLVIPRLRDKLLEITPTAFGFPLFRPLHEADRGLLAYLRLPLTDEWSEFDQCLVAATKLFIDYLNESGLEATCAEELAQFRMLNPDREIRGIDKLEIWVKKLSDDPALAEFIQAIRTIQSLRSKSAAHSKGAGFQGLLLKIGADTSSPKILFQKHVLEPLVGFSRAIISLAEKGSSRPTSAPPKKLKMQ